MGILNDVVAAVWRFTHPQANQSFQLVDPADNPHSSTRFIYLPRSETAGIRVTHDNALTFAAVFACVRVIAESVSTLTWHVYRQLENGGKERVPGQVQTLLRSLANPETTAFSWREQMLSSALLWGGGFAEIETDAAGRARALWQISPDRVNVDRTRTDGRLIYEIDNRSGSNTFLEAWQMFHLHGMGFDGITGYSIIRMAARSIAIGLAGDRLGSSFYANGTWISGVLETDSPLTDQQRANIRASWKEQHQGSDQAGHAALLEMGLKWKPLGMPMTDAQFIENRKFQISDICRWFRVPNHMVNDLERSTFSNIEQQSISFVQDTVLPWSIRLEQEADRKLFGANRQGLFTRLNINSLMRGDAESRYKAYATGRQWGWLSPNDIRELEDMNPIGAQGDVYLAPVNMVNAKALTDEERTPGMPPGGQPGQQQPSLTVTENAAASFNNDRAAHRRILLDAFAAVARREEHRALGLRKQNPSVEELSSAALALLTGPEHEKYMRDTLWQPVLCFAQVVFRGPPPAEVQTRLQDLLTEVLISRQVEAQDRMVLGTQVARDGTGSAASLDAERLLDGVISIRLTSPVAA